jgi:predicted transcriptional regulator
VQALGHRDAKRSRADLFAAVLEVISHYPEGARITKLSYGVGVPVDRLKLMVEKLCMLGLARKASDEEGVYYGVTPRGLEFLDTYWKMKGFLEELGESAGG